MKTLSVLLTVTAALATLAGCGSGSYAPKYNPNPKQEKDRLIFIDKKPEKFISFVREIEPKRLTGGELEVSLVLVNDHSRSGFLGLGGKTDLDCDVKVQFYNDEGKMVDETAWKLVKFHRGMEETITERSLTPEAADYRVNIRMKQ